MDYRHYGYGGPTADVIVDEKLEALDVDKDEVLPVKIPDRSDRMV